MWYMQSDISICQKLVPEKVSRYKHAVKKNYLGGQFFHQWDHGVFEECGCCKGSLGDLSDAQLPLRPHSLQNRVRATTQGEGTKRTVTNNKPEYSSKWSVGIRQHALWWYWPVVQQPLKVLKQGVLVLVNETHHRVTVIGDLTHREKLTFHLKIHTHTDIPAWFQTFVTQYEKTQTPK